MLEANIRYRLLVQFLRHIEACLSRLLRNSSPRAWVLSSRVQQYSSEDLCFGHVVSIDGVSADTDQLYLLRLAELDDSDEDKLQERVERHHLMDQAASR